jgi:5'-3' exonuclease
MILIDLSQVMISNVMLQVGQHTDAVQPDLLRHMILNTIRSLKAKFGAEYGEVIICADDRKYWRREYFPPYKGNRKADREKSNIDWHALFDMLNVVKQEIKDNFPYRVVQVEGAEADDVIGSICMKYGQILNNGDKILILSGDKDFVQLQVYGNVTQYDPVRKKSLTTADPEKFREHLILGGDRGDGVPNVLSPDNSIIEGLRQKPLRETKIEEILKADIKSLPEEIQRNWIRNRMLIDLREIPVRIQEAVHTEFEAQAGKPRDKMFNYLIQHKMKMLMESINEF